jgi:hypothetical protein
LKLNSAYRTPERSCAPEIKSVKGLRIIRKDSLEKRMPTPSPSLVFRMLHHTR